MFARLLGNLLSIKPNEWDGVIYFFLVQLIFSFGSSFARSIGMALLVENMDKDILPIIFIYIDLMVMVGSIIYAHYTKSVSGLAILGFFMLAATVFSVVAQALLLMHAWSDDLNMSLNWVYGFFFVGFFFLYILIFIHTGSVIASYFTAVQSKRVTGVINTGLPIGGVLGGAVLILLLNVLQIRPEHLILVFGLSCLLAFALLRVIHSRLSPVRASESEYRSTKGPIRELITGFKYFWNSRLMFYMSLGLMLFVIGNKLLEYQYQGVIYPKLFEDPTERASFFAAYEVFANIAWLLIQLFLTSRVVVTLGVGASNLLHPIMTFMVASALFLYFYGTTNQIIDANTTLMLILAISSQFVNQEMRMALRTPANNMLFNAIPPNQWGTNKAFLHGMVFPFSTIIAGVMLVFMTGNSSGFLSSPFGELISGDQLSYTLPLITLVLALLGILVALPQWAAYNAGVFGLLNRQLFNRNALESGKGSSTLKHVIEEKLSNADQYHVIAALEMIRVLRLNYFVNQVGNLMLKTRNFEIKKHCIHTIAALPQSNVNITYLVEVLKTENDPKVLPLVLKHLGQFRNVNLNYTIEKLLGHESPEIFVEATLCLYHHPQYKAKQTLERRLLNRLEKGDKKYTPLYIYGLGELHQAHNIDRILPYLDSPKYPGDVRVAAFTAFIRMLEGQLEAHKPRLVKALSSPVKEIKILALQALKECEPVEDWAPIIHLLGEKDRTLVNESKELLRLSLGECKPALIEQAFSEKISVQERFEILSLIYAKLNEAQRQRLQKMADKSLHKFIYLNGLLKIHQSMKTPTKVHDLIAKILHEVAENHLLNVVTVINYAAEQNTEFFQRVSRGLLSPSRANQGNALEVLSNSGERYLSGRVVKFFEERPNTLDAINRVHIALFERPLTVNNKNYVSHLVSLDNEMLKSCLHYIRKQRTGKWHLENASSGVKKLLRESKI